MLGDDINGIFYAGERVALFIDGANLHGMMNVLELQIDYERFRKLFASQSKLLRAYYYTATTDRAESNALWRLLDYIDQHGYTLVTKPMRYQGPIGEPGTAKGNLDVEIAVDMLKIAAFTDHLVLVSGDGDFRYLVAALQDRGKRVTVVSTRKEGTNVLARDLRRQADHFLDLDDLRDAISRQQRE